MPKPLGPHPRDRPNWDRLNEGQRRYAVEQWKLARVRRGERFDPPGEEAPEEPITETIPDSDDDEIPGSQEVIDNFDLTVLGTPGNQPEPEEDDGIDDFLNQVRDRQEAGPSGMASGSQQAMEVSSSGGTPGAKRAASSSGGSAAKVAKSGTSLPGTGGNLDGMAPGGGGGQGVVSTILRPIGVHVEHFTQTYRKKWRFLTSANANVILAEEANTTLGTPKRFALTTGMASIPWEYLFFYMSPAEYNRAKQFPGTFAKHASINIKAWNTRVAFQTGDTQTANATLNQNKFLQVAKGIRSIPHVASSNRRYNFSSTEPMQPVSFKAQTSKEYREGLKTAMYGYDNNSANFLTAPPADATGAEIYLQDYLTIYTLDARGETNPTYLPGFPPYKNFIEEYDAGQVIDQGVLSMDYNFKYAPIVPHYPAVPNNLMTLTTKPQIPSGTHYEISSFKTTDSSHTAAPTQQFNVAQRKYLQGPAKNDMFFTEDQLYFKCPIEQGGTFEEVHVQSYGDSQMPSCNIGIRAVPKLTTSDNTTQANSWLDAQGYFEVECVLVTESHDPFTYIKQNCFSQNTKTQLQYFDSAGARPVAKTYDLPNEYGRMQYRATTA
uniref:VP1 protein n=1 Tax=Rousettus bat parvovirus TaxID=3141931 RepID=A0AAU7E1U3_9VIRU